MKQLFYFLFTLSFFNAAYSQNVAINTDGSIANNSAMLDIKSTTKGMLIPRMTTAQRTAIASPATALLVYDTDANSFWFYNGSTWANLTGTGGSGSGTNWKLSGNSGTIPSSDFIGTTDNQSLVFKVNNEQSGLLNSNGTVSWGLHAGVNNTGFSNIAIGSGALYHNTDRNNLIAIGDSALYNNGIGANISPYATNNIAIGSKALYKNTTGAHNTAVGVYALSENTFGLWNTAVGIRAMSYNSRGSYNTAVGAYALGYNDSGFANVALGLNALRYNTDGVYNSSAGFEAAVNNTSGSRNSVFGAHGFYANTTGSQNTALGYQSMNANTTGSFNVALGNSALTGNTTGTNNTALGYNADVSANNLVNSTAIGYNALANASNKVVIGNSSVTSIGGFANWSNFSDGRFKQNVKEDVPGLAFINKLRPVTYTLNIDAINDFNSKGLPPEKKQQIVNADKKNEVYTGFMAQEVEQAAKSLNYNFSGIDKPKDESKQTYALRYSDFVVPLVKAIQEQQKMIDDLKKEIEALKKNN